MAQVDSASTAEDYGEAQIRQRVKSLRGLARERCSTTARCTTGGSCSQHLPLKDQKPSPEAFFLGGEGPGAKLPWLEQLLLEAPKQSHCADMNLYWLIKRFLSTYCVPSTVPGIQRRQRHVPAVKLFTVK